MHRSGFPLGLRCSLDDHGVLESVGIWRYGQNQFERAAVSFTSVSRPVVPEGGSRVLTGETK